jgi:hypothetical protein
LCWCAQEATAEALAELEVHNISTAPKFPVSLQALEAAAADEAACEQLFQQMKDAVGACGAQYDLNISPPTHFVLDGVHER